MQKALGIASKHRIVIDGDVYGAAYKLPADGLGEYDLKIPKGTSLIFTLSAGADLVATVASHLSQGKPAAPELLGPGRGFHQDPTVRRMLTLRTVDRMPDLEQSRPMKFLPCIRADGEWEDVFTCWPAFDPMRLKGSAAAPSRKDVLVHWFGPGRAEHLGPARSPEACAYYIQVGTPEGSTPQGHVTPDVARIIVTSLNEQAPFARVRKSLSYEAITVDILRHLRGTGNVFCMTKSPLAQRLGLQRPDPPEIPLFVVLRLNNAATLLYRYSGGPSPEESCYLIYGKRRAAPIITPGLGEMHGYTSLLSGHIAYHAYLHMKYGKRGPSDDEWLRRAIAQSILRQSALFERGFFHALFTWNSGDKLWERNASIGSIEHKSCLMDVESACDSVPDAKLDGSVHVVRVPIHLTVSHRTPWFTAATLLRDGPVPFVPASPPRLPSGNGGQLHATSPKKLLVESEELFRTSAVSWLANGEDIEKDISVVSIEGLRLIDRREIEDYLAMYNSLLGYSESKNAKPLSIAVFGPPGSGKSFGVTQLARYISRNSKAFAEKTLAFNVGQFASENNLSSALHQVRDECLGGRIPVVFFDEFDCTLEGQPFAWLKYFLSPMQDGEFMEGSHTYRLGKCVLVFAGGVNRSFEEMNGRLRNETFCEAKGPDFISRLRGHLNNRGVNKPDDESDHGRYILRRAVMLHQMMLKRLNLSARKGVRLMTEGVATAFCEIERFKHGVRSMEAILNMCDLRSGKVLGPSDLPAKAQLEMHVDAVSFLNSLSRAGG